MHTNFGKRSTKIILKYTINIIEFKRKIWSMMSFSLLSGFVIYLSGFIIMQMNCTSKSIDTHNTFFLLSFYLIRLYCSSEFTYLYSSWRNFSMKSFKSRSAHHTICNDLQMICNNILRWWITFLINIKRIVNDMIVISLILYFRFVQEMKPREIRFCINIIIYNTNWYLLNGQIWELNGLWCVCAFVLQ